MSLTVFFRLLKETDKAAALEAEVRAVREGRESGRRFEVDPRSFGQVPTSPFAYWVSERVRRLFKELPPFEGEGRTVKQGLATADDFRFVRCWWEVPAERILDAQHGPDWREDLEAFQEWCRQRTFEGKRWVAIVKGGASQAWFAPLDLVVNWEQDGRQMRNFRSRRTGRLASVLRNISFYFRPGFSWVRRAVRFVPYAVPAATIPSVSRYVGFAPAKTLEKTLFVLASNAITCFLRFFAGEFARPNFLVGDVKRVPFLSASNSKEEPDWISETLQSVKDSMLAYSTSECTFQFLAPYRASPLSERISLPLQYNPRRLLSSSHDRFVARQFKLSPSELRELERDLEEACEANLPTAYEKLEAESDNEGLHVRELVSSSPALLAADLVSYCVGVVMGRWDVRYATGEREAPELSDPFDPLPVCPPGMLQGEDGLPLREAPPGYPVEIDSDGILADREGHPDDIVARVREVLGLLFGERSDAIEAELVEALGARDLRAYFAKTGAGGFWQDHVKRYSASRRRAPIYWLLASPGGNVRFWVYAHRLDRDTLPKILGPRYLGGMIEGVKQELARLKPGGVVPPDLERREATRLAELEDQLVELQEMARVIREVLARTNDRGEVVGYQPHLDDGVVLAAAPLHELIPWPRRERHRGRQMSELKRRWLELEAGEYDWSRTAMLYWPSRVEVRCREDRSIAIAHGHEDLYEGDR